MPVNVEEFMLHGLGSDEDGVVEDKSAGSRKKRRSKTTCDSSSKKRRREAVNVDDEAADHQTETLSNGHESELDEDGLTKSRKEKSSGAVVEHKAALARLADSDPDFYKFLQDEDAQLLNFDLSDEEDGGDLEVAEVPSDHDEQAAADEAGERRAKDGRLVVTAQMVDEWTRQLSSPDNAPVEVVASVVEAFGAAVLRVGAEVDEDLSLAVEDSHTFNAVVRLCFNELAAVFLKVAQTAPRKRSSKKNKRSGATRGWGSYAVHIKSYLSLVVKLFAELQDVDVLMATLHHCRQLLHFFAAVPRLHKLLLNQLVRVWSRKAEQCRLLAFVIIDALIRKQPAFVGNVIKSMYLAYVQNTKLVNAETWPSINFMQRCFTEVCCAHPETAYQYAFVYIRQTAIHLRNANISKKQDLVQAVYNWQFMQCLYLWARVTAKASTIYSEQARILAELSYPLTQVILGTARLLPSARYYPLRFHCVRALLKMQAAKADTYIPILPLLSEVMSEVGWFNRKHSRQSVKAAPLDCLLKASASQLAENGFKDAVVGTLVDLLVETVQCQRASVAYPELILPTINAMTQFRKNCKVANYCRELKALAEKMEQQAKFVERRRRRAAVRLGDDSIVEFEAGLVDAASPFAMYYASWKRTKRREMAQMSKTEGRQTEGITEAVEGAEPPTESIDQGLDDVSELRSKKKTKKKEQLGGIKMDFGPSARVDGADVVCDLVLSDDDQH